MIFLLAAGWSTGASNGLHRTARMARVWVFASRRNEKPHGTLTGSRAFRLGWTWRAIARAAKPDKRRAYLNHRSAQISSPPNLPAILKDFLNREAQSQKTDSAPSGLERRAKHVPFQSPRSAILDAPWALGNRMDGNRTCSPFPANQLPALSSFIAEACGHLVSKCFTLGNPQKASLGGQLAGRFKRGFGGSGPKVKRSRRQIFTGWSGRFLPAFNPNQPQT